MQKNKILDKLLAIILIFTLTFSNFALVTESFATSIVDTLFGQSADTGHKNVKFDAYFGTENDESYSVISDVNNEDLSINLKLNVQDSGYLKDAEIKILEAEEGAGINYKLKDDLELSETVQSLEDNTIKLRQINNSSEVNILLPIEYKNEEYVNEKKLSSDSKILFTGIYVDDDGEEIELSKEVLLNVSWKDEREVRVESEVTKYIDFGTESSKGVILQTLVKVDNTTEKNSLPVKETKLDIEIPKIGGASPTKITVVANSTEGTNGKTIENLKFDENNWSIDEEKSILTIVANNEKELVKVDEFEDEFLKDADKEVVEEERYYSKSGIDEYLITYTFENIDFSEEMQISSSAQAKLTTFSGVERDENINIVTNKQNYDYKLSGQTGDIVSLNIENETNDISKAYTYVNYNKDNHYEVEYTSNTMINISYKEIVEGITIEDIENIYKDKEGNVIPTNDLYYKQISISKENFDLILGEEGEIKITDIDGNVIAVINNEYEVNEDGNFVFNFNNKCSKIIINTTAPIEEGSLVINNKKATSNATIDKDTFKNIQSIGTKVIAKAKYSYVDNLVEIGTSEVSTKLTDTSTKVNFVLDRDSISTLSENENVEMRIELNNATDKSDVYGYSVFEIALPEYIEKFEITNANILYGEGLDIVSVETIDRILRVTIDGKQEGINSGVLTNGTNIVINANIKTDIFTPFKEDSFILNYTNNESSSYEDEGKEEAIFNYSAPTGLVTVNSTANYNNVGTILTSVRQGTQRDIIDIYSEAKTATMEIIVMNNNKNTVSNLSILGRIPFKGVKDIESGEELGTTLDTKMINGIVSDEHNNASFKVYYSENEEATNDLNNSSNEWIENPESYENIKSYLIIPEDENYEMSETEKIRFTYEYEIPGDLNHNEDIYGTFLAYYTNNSEVAVTDESSKPDLIGLTTGEGPELGIDVSVDKERIKESEELLVNINIKNTGKEVVRDIVTTIPVPENTKFVSLDSKDAEVISNNNENTITVNSSELEENKTLELTLKLEIEDVDEEKEISINASVNAKDLGKELVSETKQVKLIASELSIKEFVDDLNPVEKEGNTLDFRINVKNLTNNEKENIVVTKVLPEGLKFVEAYNLEKVDNGNNTSFYTEMANGDNATFDEATRKITWNIGKLNVDETEHIKLIAEVDSLKEGVTKEDIKTSTVVKADGTDEYESNSVNVIVGKPSLTVNQTTTNTDSYIKEGTNINYTFTVKNEGALEAEDVNLIDQIPEGLSVRKITTEMDGLKSEEYLSSNSTAEVVADILPNSELTVNIEAFATGLNGVQEKTVTNFATVSALNINKMESNSITHIVEADPEISGTISSQETSNGYVSSGSTNNNDIVKTYKLSGIAWLDSNRNGMRDDGEELLSGTTVRLVNSETGIIQNSITTDSKGTYAFSGIQNGNYLVLFEYDTAKYTVTSYQKEGVAPNVNSDAITTRIEQDGKVRNGAVTDVITIADGSISNIDIGFVLADKFDLKLDKTISKVTSQTKAGTNSDVYQNETLAKTEIAAKNLTGSTVYVEYEITISNVGDLAGYAKKIVDYIPSGMTFNSGLEANSNWYTGTDGNLYSSALSEVMLTPGESKTIKLVLTKQMTEENTGIVNNLAEIYEDYNEYGVSDINSIPANKAQGENDLGAADLIIAVKTGETLIYISVIITTLLLGSIVIFISYNKLIIRKRKGGV